MTDLPTPVAAYFAAWTPEQIADCFAVDGVAFDEGHTYTGRDEILRWRAGVAGISFTQQILTSAASDDTIAVTCRVAGNFSGSPVELHYDFRLAAGRIAQLRIT